MILSSDQLKVLQGILGADPSSPAKALKLSGRLQAEPNDPGMRALQQQGAVMCLQAARPDFPLDIWLVTEAGIREVQRSLEPA